MGQLDGMSKVIDKEEQKLVSISNIASRSAQGLSLIEKRMLALGFSKNNPLKAPHGIGYDQRRIKITAIEYAKEFDVSQKTAYRDLQKACANLFDRYLRYEIKTPKGLKERKLRWVQDVTYHHGEGWIEYQFTSAISQHLFKLEKNFTTYKLKQASALRSIYSWRLFELILSWRSKDNQNIGDFTIDLDKFREAMEIPSSYTFKDIRKRCIESSIKELKQKDGIVVVYNTIKKGRSVYKIHFRWDKIHGKDD